MGIEKAAGKETGRKSSPVREVILENGIEKIEYKAFYYCESLEKVAVPSTVTEIEPNAFKGCKQVTIIAEPRSYAETFANEKGIPVQNP